MKKIILTIVIICVGLLLWKGISSFSSNKTETGFNFYDKHFYFGWMTDEDLKKGVAGTRDIGEYMQVTFWMTFVFSLIVVLINTGLALSHSRIDKVTKLGFYLNKSIIIFYHLIYWVFLMFLGIFYANLGTGWFVFGGILSAIGCCVGMSALDQAYLVPFSKTISKYFDTIKKYNLIYNNVKTQEIWNQ